MHSPSLWYQAQPLELALSQKQWLQVSKWTQRRIYGLKVHVLTLIVVPSAAIRAGIESETMVTGQLLETQEDFLT
jgi:hypothetical protein